VYCGGAFWPKRGIFRLKTKKGRRSVLNILLGEIKAGRALAMSLLVGAFNLHSTNAAPEIFSPVPVTLALLKACRTLWYLYPQACTGTVQPVRHLYIHHTNTSYLD
jgi:hypothetical protein